MGKIIEKSNAKVKGLSEKSRLKLVKIQDCDKMTRSKFMRDRIVGDSWGFEGLEQLEQCLNDVKR